MIPPATQLDEAGTREAIDLKLAAAGWIVQDKSGLNLYAGETGIHGIAVREMDTDTGPADYMLFVDGKVRCAEHMRQSILSQAFSGNLMKETKETVTNLHMKVAANAN